MDAKVLVAITYGLSSAGKSTLVKKLEAQIPLSQLFCPCTFLHLEIDLVETLIRNGRLISQDLTELQGQLKWASELPYTFSREAIEKARQETFDLVGRLLHKAKGESLPPITLIIIVDDNHLTKGIRKRYKNMCRSTETGFAELYFPVDVDKAIERSQKRLSKVIDPQVITKDSQIAELSPGPFTITVDSDVPINNLADQLAAVFQSSIHRFKGINCHLSQTAITQPKSTLTEIEELLRSIVCDFIVEKRKIDPNFKGQTTMSTLKKEFYQHLKAVNQNMPQSDALDPAHIRAEFMNIIKASFPES